MMSILQWAQWSQKSAMSNASGTPFSGPAQPLCGRVASAAQVGERDARSAAFRELRHERKGESMPCKLAIGVDWQGRLDLPRILARVAVAEAAGVDSVWIPEA